MREILIIFAWLSVPIALLLLTIWSDEKKRKKQQKEREALANEEAYITPKELLKLRQEQKGFTGIYIIYNRTKDLVYVGQGQNVYVRSSNHFLGKGNADIYADYKYGDEFTIRFVSLINSGFDRLDTLERHYIYKYHATIRGYNKTKGNK